jgi:transposase
MSDDYQRIEVITGAARRRRWTTEEKLRIVDETLRSGESISVLARRHGVAPNLLYRWRRLMTEGGAVAVQADDAVTGNAELRRLDERMRELERQLGRKTLEVEILLARRGGIFPLYVASLERLKGSQTTCTFVTAAYFESMVRFVQRRMEPFASFVGETRGVSKDLAQPPPSGSAS